MRKGIDFCILLLSTVVLVSSCAQPIDQNANYCRFTSSYDTHKRIFNRSQQIQVALLVNRLSTRRNQDYSG